MHLIESTIEKALKLFIRPQMTDTQWLHNTYQQLQQNMAWLSDIETG